MDAGRRHKTPESKTKRTVYLFRAIAVACISAFVPVLGAPVPHREAQGGIGDTYTRHGLYYRTEALSLGNLNH